MSESQPLRRSLQIALAAALVVVAAGLVFAFTQHGRYKAETSLIVLPANTLTAADQANFLETLSRGQVTATMAEVAQSGRFENEAEKAMGLSASQAADSTVTVTVVPSTSVLLITADASDKKVAEDLADRTAALAGTYLKTMIKPYSASQVSPASGTAYAAGIATWMVVVGSVAAALAVAVAAQQASYQILLARRRSRRGTQPARRPAPSTNTSVPAPATGRAGVASVPAAAATPTAVTPAVAADAPVSGAPSTSTTSIGSAPVSSPSFGSSAVGSSAVGSAAVGSAAVGSSPVPSSFSSTDWNASSLGNGSSSNSSFTSSASLSSSDWRSTTYGSAGSTNSDDDETSTTTDSPAPSDEAGVTNERVLFS